jgi:uncharacterized RDD family membrane protein YckC
MTQCASCGAAVAPGSRWCGICRSSTVYTASHRLGSPGKRLGAYILDGLIPVVVVISTLGAAVAAENGGGLGAAVLWVVFLAYVVWALYLFSKGKTPGKLILGMQVVKEDGQHAGFFRMLIREWVGKFISGLVFALGFLWILFDQDRQGWHDKLMSTYVVERA